jgi:hypothetical protein
VSGVRPRARSSRIGGAGVAGVKRRRVRWSGRRGGEIGCFYSYGVNRLQRVRKVATFPRPNHGYRLGVRSTRAARCLFGPLAPERASVLARARRAEENSSGTRSASLLQTIASYIHYLRQPPVFHDEAVFALSVEQIRPMAGRPVRRVPWGFHMTFWESAAVTYLDTEAFFIRQLQAQLQLRGQVASFAARWRALLLLAAAREILPPSRSTS